MKQLATPSRRFVANLKFQLTRNTKSPYPHNNIAEPTHSNGSRAAWNPQHRETRMSLGNTRERETVHPHGGSRAKDADAEARSSRETRNGLNKDWFCGRCGGYHPRGQVVCTGSVEKPA